MSGEDRHSIPAGPARDNLVHITVNDRHPYLQTVTKRAPATINTVLAALGDFYIRTGLGAPDVRRLDLPQRAPRALTARDVTRWLRTVERWLNPRDRVLALIPFHAGLRIGEAVALDVDDIQLSARKGLIIVRSGKGNGYREIQVHAELRAKPRALDQRRTPHWAGADTSPALLLNNHGDRLGARGARDVLVAIADEAGVNDEFSSHVLRHTFGTTLVRDGHDLVLVAELMGHARVETTRAYSLPTAEDRQRAINSLPTNRLPSLEPNVNHQFHQLRTGHQRAAAPGSLVRHGHHAGSSPLLRMAEDPGPCARWPRRPSPCCRNYQGNVEPSCHSYGRPDPFCIRPRSPIAHSELGTTSSTRAGG